MKSLLALLNAAIFFMFNILKNNKGEIAKITAKIKVVRFFRKNPQELEKSNLDLRLKLKNAKSF